VQRDKLQNKPREDMLNTIPVLMLSTGYEPLFQTSWRRAIRAIYSGRAEIIEVHEFLTIGSSQGPLPFPTKVRFITGIIAAKVKNLNTGAVLSKKSLFLRDRGICQYCSKNISLSIGTVDHVVPKSKGGGHVWQNVVWSCEKCNQKKGSRLLNETSFNLPRCPKQPTIYEILNIRTRNRDI